MSETHRQAFFEHLDECPRCATAGLCRTAEQLLESAAERVAQAIAPMPAEPAKA